MRLSDQDISRNLKEGRIRFREAIDPNNIRPTGIRLHLDHRLLLPDASTPIIDLKGATEPKFALLEISAGGFVLRPGEFVLGSSVEHISVANDLLCILDGRSTIARLGILVHCASTTFDNNHDEPRSVTFELANVGPFEVRLRRGDPIAMLSFEILSGPVVQSDQDQYKGQSGPTPPHVGFKPKEGKIG